MLVRITGVGSQMLPSMAWILVQAFPLYSDIGYWLLKSSIVFQSPRNITLVANKSRKPSERHCKGAFVSGRSPGTQKHWCSFLTPGLVSDALIKVGREQVPRNHGSVAVENRSLTVMSCTEDHSYIYNFPYIEEIEMICRHIMTNFTFSTVSPILPSLFTLCLRLNLALIHQCLNKYWIALQIKVVISYTIDSHTD